MKTHILECFGAKTLNVKPCLRSWTKRGPENYSENLERNKEVTWDFSAPSSGEANTCISCTLLRKVLSMPSCQGISEAEALHFAPAFLYF